MLGQRQGRIETYIFHRFAELFVIGTVFAFLMKRERHECP